MADLRVMTSGKVFFKVDSQLAAILLEAFPERFIPVAPAQPIVPTFDVGALPGAMDAKPCIIFRLGAQVEYFSGTIEQARNYKPRGLSVPTAVVAGYERSLAIYNNNNQSAALSDCERDAAAQHEHKQKGLGRW